MATTTSENSFRRFSQKAGLPPGALVHVGRRRAERVKITIIDYNKDSYGLKECKSLDECVPHRDNDRVSWINVDGLHDVDSISRIGEIFGLDTLALEEVLNTGHRPKMEHFDNYAFVTFKMLGVSPSGKSIVSEQVSAFLGEGWVLTFQEQEGDIFDPLRERLRDNYGTIRQRGPDYLLYRFIDITVDNYFLVIEFMTEAIDKLEAKIIDDPEHTSLAEIQQMKRQLINLRKTIAPLREVILALEKEPSNFIKEKTLRYLRDVYEHVIQVMDSIESSRDTVASIMDLHMSSVSNRMNQVMQVLTIIATIFIPLTFIAGIYGMNFEHMPELHYKYSYYIVWGVMLAVVFGMLIYFRRKKWL